MIFEEATMTPEAKRIFNFLYGGLLRDDGVKGDPQVGMEIETPFLDVHGTPIALETSQNIFRRFLESDLAHHFNWKITGEKGGLITEVSDYEGSRISYELGRHNIELSLMPKFEGGVAGIARNYLRILYAAAEKCGAFPCFEPIVEGDEDLLVIPDDRDDMWQKLDGRAALRPLARISSVQFTVDILNRRSAIETLNRFGERIDDFLADYPQDRIWKEYISNSTANYRNDRYGGPLFFESAEAYCTQLTLHDVVRPPGELVPHNYLPEIDIPLFVRSVWWYFRLRRFPPRTDRLVYPRICIEVRPMARRSDDHFDNQLRTVLDIVNW